MAISIISHKAKVSKVTKFSKIANQFKQLQQKTRIPILFRSTTSIVVDDSGYLVQFLISDNNSSTLSRSIIQIAIETDTDKRENKYVASNKFADST